ncbi:MAG: restriction endonuclease subunit S, partial [Bacteroidetes bacterium]|nr:restriction endonuclease subunit S [Bacteroidota bacterium]
DQDHNLAVSSYVIEEDTREKIDIKLLNAQIALIVMRQQKLRQKIQEIIMDLERRSGLNTIEGLIEKLCPEGVEFKELGDIAQLQRGTAITKKQIKSGDIPVIAGGRKPAYFHNVANREGETITVAGSGAYAGHLNFWNEPIFISDGFSIKSNSSIAIMKYIFYFLSNNQSKIYNMKCGAGIPHVYVKNLTPFHVPVPPLEVQNAIVEILDTFTALQQELEAELEAELEERKKQYEYYREEQLSFDDNEVEWKTLGEIGELVRGSGIQKSDFTDFGVGCIHYGQIHTSFGVWADKTVSYISPELADRSRKASKGNLIITTTSEDDEGVAKAVAWIGDQDIAISTDAIIFKHDLNPKYVSYLFQTDLFRKQKKVRITGTKVRRISANNLAKIKIPIPSLEKQKEIVATLDNFDALVNDLSIGIPAEIKARRLQLEYYQNHLLTFKKAPTDNKVT